MSSHIIRTLRSQDAPMYRALRLEALAQSPQSFLSTFEVELAKPISSFEYELSLTYQPPIWGYYGLIQSRDSADKNNTVNGTENGTVNGLDNDEILDGFCQISHSTLTKQPHVGFLYNLYITPQKRNQGLATKLLNQVVQLMKKESIEYLYISHIRSNDAAHQFYTRYGFQTWGTRPDSVKWHDHQQHPRYDDEVEMVLSLKNH